MPRIPNRGLSYNLGCLAVFAAIFAIVGFVFAILHRSERNRLKSWPTTPGVITKVIEHVDTDADTLIEHTSHSVQFEYKLDGKTYTAGENTAGYQPYAVGDRVLVRYSGRSPYEVRLDNELGRNVSYHMTFALLMVVLAAILFALAYVTSRRRADTDPRS